MIAFSVANIIGPQLFQAYSAPDYHPAKIVILVTQCLCVPLTLFIGWMLKCENLKRDENQTQEVDDVEFLDKTDIENRQFRYTY